MGQTGSKYVFAQSLEILINQEELDLVPGYSSFLRETISLADLYEIATADIVRAFRAKRPERYIEVLELCSHTILDQVESEGGKKDGYSKTAAVAAMNSVRSLARLLSVAFEETEGEFRQKVEALFWTVEDGSTLGNAVANAIGYLLFGVGLCISTNAAQSKIWEGGVGVETVPKSGRSFDTNRIEILRCVIALCSAPTHFDPNSYGLARNSWLEAFTSDAFVFPRELFFSLVNTALNFDPVGWGIPFSNLLTSEDHETLFETSLHVLLLFLDYTPPRSALEAESQPAEEKEGANDKKEELKETKEETEVSSPGHSTENLSNEEPKEPEQAEIVAENREEATPEDKEDNYENMMISYMMNINASKDVERLVRRIVELLFNHTHGGKSVLSIAYDTVEAHQELLVLLWRVITMNGACLQYLLVRADLEELVVAMLSIVGSGRKDYTANGCIHVISFVLLLLSSERNFAVRLNVKAKKIPDGITPPAGTYCLADHVLMIFYKVIVDGSHDLRRLHECFLTILTNLSPYVKKWSMAASLCFVRLFDIFFSAKTFREDQRLHVHLPYLFDFVNNVLQYQYADNCNFLYALLRAEKSINRILAIATAPVEPPVDEPEMPQGPSPTSARLEKQPSLKELIKSMQKAKVSQQQQEQQTPQNNVGAEEPNADEEIARSVAFTEQWRRKLKIGPVQRFFECLAPAVEQFCRENLPTEEAPVLQFISDTNLVGLLPQPHPIVVHRYHPNDYTDLWFSTFTWGLVFVRQSQPFLFDPSKVKLFSIGVPAS